MKSRLHSPASLERFVSLVKRLTLDWTEIVAFMLSILIVFCAILIKWPKKLDLHPIRTANIQTAQEISFAWPLKNWSPLPQSAQIREQLLFSIAPPRPDRLEPAPSFLLHFLRAGIAQPIQLPAKIGLIWNDEGTLSLGSPHSLFWLEVTDSQATLCIQSPQNGTVLRESWLIEPTSAPLQSSLTEKSCFRSLAEIKWVPDAVLEHFNENPLAYRTETFGVTADGWLVHRNGSWEPLTALEYSEGRPIAHLISHSSGNLEIEGWEGDHYVRFPAQLGNMPSLRLRSEDFISQLRIRSDTQASCTLDKQCLVLHVGDWVIKRDQRWTIIRSPQEKQKILNETLPGDLFCLEEIEAGRSSIKGHYFATNRMQSIPIERTVERRVRIKK